MKADLFKQFGVIGKAHGLEGVVRVQTKTPAVDDVFDSDRVLYLQNRRGDLVPVRVESVREESKRGSHSFFVKFDKFTNRTDAEAYQDCLLFAEGPIEQENEASVNDPEDIIGFDALDSSGIEAKVTDLLENPAHMIIVMESGDNSFMVPWVDEYVLSVDMVNRHITCRNLDQLTDL